MKIFRHLLVPALLLLTACDGDDVQKTLGLERTAPDEFVVYSRPPLSVPPEFDLKPPRPGEEGVRAPSTQATARELLLGTTSKPASLDEALRDVDTSVETAVTPVLSADAPSAADASFLKKLGVDVADPDIRATLQKDSKVAPKKQKQAQSLLERISGEETAEPLVDPKKEAERIRSNRDQGKKITEGETPVKKVKPASVIDRIF